MTHNRLLPLILFRGVGYIATATESNATINSKPLS